MPKTLTIPVDVTHNGVKYTAGSTPNVNSVVADDIVLVVQRHNDMLSMVQRKTRGSYTDGTAV